MDCLIPCVNYDDFLFYTLPTIRPYFKRILVITTPKDKTTKQFCIDQRIAFITTDAWYLNGAIFNKAAALNVGLEYLNSTGWLCVLDADIMLPENWDINNLDPDNLYSAKRRMCTKHSHFLAWRRDSISINQFYIQEIPVRPTKKGLALWGNPNALTDNAAGVLGYLQLWHQGRHKLAFPINSVDASSYDVQFALKWPENNRKWLEQPVVHLGAPKTNWSGRITARWR